MLARRLPPLLHSFGSFEVCRGADATTGRAGPSPGQAGPLLTPLLGYVLQHHYPELWRGFAGGGDDIRMAYMSDAQVRAVLCCAVLCCAVLCCAVLCCAALRCAALRCAALHCAVLRR
jgi:hypothetical protein